MVSARYGCKFPAKYNKPAISYYREHISETWPTCMFIFNLMDELNDYTIGRDELQHMCEDAPEVWPALFESFIYVAYEDIKKNGRKPKNLVLVFD